jgi:ferric-dicitrate binding protein FerR (iron transport regulator)
MSGYIHHIIRYFFHHDASDEMTARVQERLGHLGDEADETIRQIWDECGEATANDASTEKAYRQMMTALQGSQPSIKRFSWLKMAAMWAIPLILLGAAAWFYSVATERAKLYSEVVFMHKFTAYGERSMIILPDSSKVWLNGGSSLIYPSRFISAERNVCLTGEAYFEVKKDKSRPFTVDVNQMKLKVLGTTFNVFSYPDNPQIVATLETGKVQITVANKKKPYILEPNEQLVLDSKTGDVELHNVNAPDFSVWRVPSLYFEETKLIYAFQQIERTYNVKIHVQNSHYNNQTIRAHFNSDETIEGIMAVIKMLIPAINYEIEGNDIFIN